MRSDPLPYHRENLEEALLETAADIIATRGYDALSLRELGRALNVSRAAPYHYFKDKAALLARVGELGFRRLGARIGAAQDATSPLPVRMHQGLRAYLQFAMDEPNFFRLMFADLLKRDLGAAVEAEKTPLDFSSASALLAFKSLVDGVLLMQREGQLRDGDPLLLVNVFWSYAHGVAVLAAGRHLKQSDAESVLETGVDALLRAFAPPQRQRR